MEVLGTLFGSKKKIKILRLFLFNPHELYDHDDIAERTQLHKNSVKKYVKMFEKIDFIRSEKFASAKDSGSKKRDGWVLNSEFRYLEPLHNLLVRNDPMSKEEVRKRLSEVGEIRLLILSGVFLQEWNARVDIFVVGDDIQTDKLEEIVRELETEIGKELTYAQFDTTEFHYRQNVYDKLIRDVLDYPHEKVIDTLESEGLEAKAAAPER